jgi:hypothetical protein
MMHNLLTLSPSLHVLLSCSNKAEHAAVLQGTARQLWGGQTAIPVLPRLLI